MDADCPGSETCTGIQERLRWLGSGLNVDVWTSSNYTSTTALANYPGTTFFLTGANEVNLGALNPGPGQTIAVLVKADGALNTLPDGEYGFFCNSRTWRSGGQFEIPEAGFSGLTSFGRDTSIGDPTP